MILAAIVALLLGALTFLYRRWTRNHGTLEKLGIPVKAPFLCFGSGPWAIHKQLLPKNDKEWFDSLGGSSLTVGYYEGVQPVVVTIDPELVKEVFVKKFDCFQDRMVLEMDESLKSLDVLAGEQWSFLRKSLSPVFTSGKIKAMIDPIEECVGEGLRYLDGKADGSDGVVEVEVKPFMDLLAMEVILKVAFGIEGNMMGKDSLNTNSPLFKRMLALMGDVRSKSFLEDAIFVLLQLEPNIASMAFASFKDGLLYLDGLVKEVVKARDSSGAGETGDFIDTLRRLLKSVKDAGGKLHDVTADMITAQGSLFLFAGFDTTSATLSNLISLLSRNQDVQDRCHQDVRDHASRLEDINYETIAEMRYVDACISEALRLHPPSARTMRLCTKDVTVKGMEIKKGTRVDAATYVLQRCQDIYGEDADVFDPERFLSGGKSRSDVAFNAFGFGPRQCLGSRFALVKIKMVIAKLLFKYKILNMPGWDFEYAKGAGFASVITKSNVLLKKRQEKDIKT